MEEIEKKSGVGSEKFPINYDQSAVKIYNRLHIWHYSLTTSLTMNAKNTIFYVLYSASFASRCSAAVKVLSDLAKQKRTMLLTLADLE